MAQAIDARERERSQIAAGVSHELRTPLTILTARLHGIRDGIMEARPGETELMLRQLEQILHIVDDLDTLSNTDTGPLAIDCEYVDLQEIIQPLDRKSTRLNSSH